ncbi:MAG: tryptophanase [Calditrichota bacterium]
MKSPIEPFRIKVVEPVKLLKRTERDQMIRNAGFNVFKLPAESIFIDLLTDSGTSAMSDNQWAGMMIGDESYAGCRNFYHLKETVKSVFDFDYLLPTHQGRAAENILFHTLAKKGDVIPSNIHFDTTRANIEFIGAVALDCVIDEGLIPELEHPFKGNMDPKKLEKVIKEQGKDKIPMVALTITNNSGGGQPASMQNMKEISQICRKHNLRLFIDAARFVVNIGGFIALRDGDLFQKLQNLLILQEGFPTYGGLAGRDLEAIARGLQDVLHEDYLQYRIQHTAYLGNMIANAGIPVVKPIGGHAVYIDAKKFLPHLPQSKFPGQALTVALYREAGIRAVEIGSLMFARQEQGTGKWIYPKLELVRLAIPRRVYTASHLEYVAEAAVSIRDKKETLKGLKLVNEPPFLRHFTAIMEEID